MTHSDTASAEPLSHSSSRASRGTNGRDPGLDALRTLAVLAMMGAHTARLINLDARPDWSRWILLLEPIIPSLFLLLVGLSLAASRAAWSLRHGEAGGAGEWYRRHLRRAAALWLVSAVFASLELGIRLPDVLLAGGILANIAYAIAFTAGLLALPTKTGRTILPVALALAVTVFITLDVAGRGVYPVNTGNAPFLPLWIFALAGALWGTLFHRPSGRTGAQRVASLPRWFHLILGILGGAVAVWLMARHGVDALFTKPLGRSDAARLAPAPLLGGAPRYLAYYNLRPLLAACCLGIHLGALVLLQVLLAKLPEGFARRAFALGRHALGAYIFHLAMLAALVVTWGLHPLKAGWQGTGIWVLVALICWIWAIWREHRLKPVGAELPRPYR